MSCNYYLYTKDANLAFDLMPRVIMDGERRILVVHLCQTAIGWKTCFECHSYRSFKELKELLLKNSSLRRIKIEDEYGTRVSITTFIRWMEERNEDCENRSRILDEKDESYCGSVFDDGDGFEFLDEEFD